MSLALSSAAALKQGVRPWQLQASLVRENSVPHLPPGVVGYDHQPENRSGHEENPAGRAITIDLQEYDRLTEFENAVLNQLPYLEDSSTFWLRAAIRS